uniref:ER membrane protein complex subunit 2 n=1 Tax=Xenopsylla cheopis TaxID=163159 RepID=A0A6M2DJK9_XENCH
MYNFEELDWTDVRDLFRKWREGNERKSDDVIQLWEAVLEDRQEKLGNERYIVLEQIIISALDCARIDIADKCIKILNKKFPKSLRVLKYQAMKLEAMECYDDALQILETLISRDETNAAPRKRRITIFMEKGRNVDAIKELTDYLKIFMSDQEAWQMLSDLYLAEGDLSKAAFCIEELILHNPHSHLLHQRLADIKYTQGAFENWEIAKVYYCQSIKLNPNNVRSLYGLYLASINLSNSQKLAANKKKEHIKLAQWALQQVKNIHDKQKCDSSLVKSLESALGSLQI